MNLYHLISEYDSDDSRRRLVAIQGMSALQDALTVPVLLRALQDPSFIVRVHAAIGLARLGDVRSVGALLTVIHDKRLPDSLYPDIWEALACTCDPRATEALMDVLETTTVHSQRYALIRALGVTEDSRVLRPLCAWLADPDALVAVAAADALGSLGDPRAIPHLEGYIRDPDERVRLAVADALLVLRRR